ncbi:MAG: DUF1592 domain-containing protein [Pirellulales bacterium]|nr:DUF1592 domain-containing protein [Pirellulales bacterium]
MRSVRPSLWWQSLLSVALMLAATSAEAFEASSLAKAFLKKHCQDCHDPETKEGGLDLSALSPKLASTESLRRWTQIYDRVDAGEMPPQDADQPSASARAEFLQSLKPVILEADRQHRQVILRRLNRAEYENTVRDLFGIEVELREMLPEDAVAGGFDNIGEALSISTEQMQAYLAAANAALDAAIVKLPRPQTRTVKGDLRSSTERSLGSYFAELDDGVVIFTSGYVPSMYGKWSARVAGNYRVRITANTHNSKLPIPMRVYAGNFYSRTAKSHLVDYFDVDSAEPRTFEFVDRFEKNDTIKPAPYGLPHWIKDPVKGSHPGLAVRGIEIEGPLVDQWPPKSHRLLFGDLPLEPEKPARYAQQDGKRVEILTVSSTNPAKDAAAVLARIVPRAFRRPVTEADVAPFLKLATDRLAAGRSFEDSIRVALVAVLCSPRFLFLEESNPGQELDDYQLATRLSYFLWSTMPDAKLTELAAAGELRGKTVLRREVERMLSDPRAQAFTENLLGQWMKLRDINFTTPDKELYPEFDELLKYSMVRETHLFFEELLKNDLSVENLVDSDFVIVNQRLAEHYGIKDVKGLTFRKVQLPADSPRGGVMTHASVLKVTANGTNTSPVYRGIWVLENIIGEHAPPPPGDVPAVEPDIRGASTIREQLARHRDVASCRACHRKIDPPGFALENFDVIGGYRPFYRKLGVGRFKVYHQGKPVKYRHGPRVDASGTMADGRSFKDINEFKRLLLEDKSRIAGCATQKLLTYALGRELGFSDRAAVAEIVKKVASKGYGLRSLVHEVVASETFRTP